MKEVIIKLLTEKAPGARKDGLEIMANTLAMAAKDKENAKEMVDGITTEQITDFISNYRKGADAEITKATKTAEENLRKRYEFVDKNKQSKGEEETKEPEPGKTEPSAEMQKLLEQINAYKAEVDAMKAGNIKATRREKFQDAIKGAPESIRKLMSETFESREFGTDEDFDKYLETAKEKATGFEKEFNTLGLRAFGAPQRADTDADEPSAGAKAYAKKRFKK